MIWYSIYFKDLFHCTASHVISIMYNFAMLLPWGIPIVYKVYMVIWYGMQLCLKLCKFDDTKLVYFTPLFFPPRISWTPRFVIELYQDFLEWNSCLALYAWKYNMVRAKCEPRWTSTHQCTIQWMPVITQLWMNLNWVNIWSHLGNPFCKK
jgi:hypothetical protein